MTTLSSPVSAPLSDGDRTYDVVGIGIGPANLALAVALHECGQDSVSGATGRPLDHVFLEAHPTYAWHPGMLLEGSLLQITALKDLATMRNPRSRFTFLNYLHEQDRLFHFLNLRDLFPTRIEFTEYLKWVAGELAGAIRYGRRVTAVRRLAADLLEVEAQVDGRTERYRARNVVVATGGQPVKPENCELPEWGPRVIHPQAFLPRLAASFSDETAKWRFLVVGSGQSGAEIFYYLMDHYPAGDVTQALRGFGYKPVDESDFTNEVFFPENRSFFYNLPDGIREGAIDAFRDVNYAVVDHPLIKRIYRRLYDEKVAGKERARVLRYQHLERVTDEPGEPVRAEFRHVLTGARTTVECDAVVVASGYGWSKDHALLTELAPHFVRGESGEVCLGRDYSVATGPELAAGLYLQGYEEATHGISATVLSLIANRAQDIVDSILARGPGGAP